MSESLQAFRRANRKECRFAFTQFASAPRPSNGVHASSPDISIKIEISLDRKFARDIISTNIEGYFMNTSNAVEALAGPSCGDRRVIAKLFFLECHWTEIAQRRMKPAMIVELKPVHHLVFCLPARAEPHSVQPLDLE